MLTSVNPVIEISAVVQSLKKRHPVGMSSTGSSERNRYAYPEVAELACLVDVARFREPLAGRIVPGRQGKRVNYDMCRRPAISGVL